MSMVQQLISAVTNAERQIDDQISKLHSYTSEIDQVTQRVQAAFDGSQQEYGRNMLDQLSTTKQTVEQSVYEEIYDILHRRGVERIEVTEEFNPALCKAVKSNENPDVDSVIITGVIRNGYTFSGKVIRAAEVTVDRPMTT